MPEDWPGAGADAVSNQLMSSINAKLLPQAASFIHGMLQDHVNIGVGPAAWFVLVVRSKVRSNCEFRILRPPCVAVSMFFFVAEESAVKLGSMNCKKKK